MHIVLTPQPYIYQDVKEKVTHGNDAKAKLYCEVARSRGPSYHRANPNAPNEESERQFWICVESSGTFQDFSLLCQQ